VRAWGGICRSPINRPFGASRVVAKAYRGKAILERVVRRGNSDQLDPWLTLFLDKDSKPERVPDEPSAGPFPPPCQISLTTPSATKSFSRKDFSEVPETPKLDYKSYPKRSNKGPDHYSESGCVRLVPEPDSYQEAMSSLAADT